ncbi:hypothetical protein GCM10009098_17730 [Rheinheimera aquimaris]|uniref:Uncharacterized protein n=1 Tax=Rheinheimera aquimaris TaxID=412437 RepID=A0ABN1DRR0_9GAMM
MNFPGIKHAKPLIMLGLFGFSIGAIFDLLFKTFPLFSGVGMLSFELALYLYLKIKYRKEPDQI